MQPMTSQGSAYEIHSEERGHHFVAWVTRPGSTKPDKSVLLVAASREEAETRARHWAQQTTY